MAYRVGCVPYVNALPLIQAFREDPEISPVEVVLDVPSRLPSFLEAGEVDAILVSSIYTMLAPDLRIATRVGIASDGAVESVRLFSRVPFDQVRSLATDQSSMTSNALAQIILSEQYGVRPSTNPMPPDLESMLAAADAAVLIGDKGMLAQPGPGVLVLDLGTAWFELTGLPFVWALWVGREGLSEELVEILQGAAMSSAMGATMTAHLNLMESMPKDERDQIFAEAQASLPEELHDLVSSWEDQSETLRNRREELLQHWTSETGWERARLEGYLTETMTYELGSDHIDGLERFGSYVVELEIVSEVHQPTFVGEVSDDELEFGLDDWDEDDEP